MFTGIVQAMVSIDSLIEKPGLVSFTVQLPEHLRGDLSLGASIAINGVCLTVTQFDDGSGLVSFDVMQQSLDLTTAGAFQVGSMVNLERSAKAMQEVGGHIVSGHIDAMAKVVAIESEVNNRRIRFAYPQHLAKYIFDKGFIGLNGCSLTIAQCDVDALTLDVCFIPETLRATNFGLLEVGDAVNLEVERQTQAIVNTVERVLAQQASAKR